MESGYDDVNEVEFVDEFGWKSNIYYVIIVVITGQMTRDRRMKREVEFFFSNVENVESAELFDDHTQVSTQFSK
jgi:hypothetical protein